MARPAIYRDGRVKHNYIKLVSAPTSPVEVFDMWQEFIPNRNNKKKMLFWISSNLIFRQHSETTTLRCATGDPSRLFLHSIAFLRITSIFTCFHWNHGVNRKYRPSSTAATMDEKLSSANTISAADLATAVPEPIAIPISAFFRAGASFTPSPVYNSNLFTVKKLYHFVRK